MINERIKRIEGYKDYFITESGRVFTQRLRGNQTKHRLRELTAKKPGNNPRKYLNIILINNDGYKTFMIHRLVAQYFVPGYFDGAVVNHIDGNNRNNHYTNLEWTTQLDNIHKSYIHSGIDQYRNYKIWDLYDPDNNLLGSFIGSNKLRKFIDDNLPNVSSSMVAKWGNNKGYYIKKRDHIAKELKL